MLGRNHDPGPSYTGAHTIASSLDTQGPRAHCTVSKATPLKCQAAYTIVLKCTFVQLGKSGDETCILSQLEGLKMMLHVPHGRTCRISFSDISYPNAHVLHGILQAICAGKD